MTNQCENCKPTQKKSPLTVHEHIEFYLEQMQELDKQINELAEKNDFLQRAKIELNGAVKGLKQVVNAALAEEAKTKEVTS